MFVLNLFGDVALRRVEKLEGGLDVSSKVGGGSSEQERDSNAIGLSDDEDF